MAIANSQKVLLHYHSIMNQPIQNWEEALERVGGDQEFLLELLGDFSHLLPEYFPALQEAASNQNSLQLKETAHTLKGAVRNLSLHSLSEVVIELEQIGKEERWADFQKAFGELRVRTGIYQQYVRELTEK